MRRRTVIKTSVLATLGTMASLGLNSCNQSNTSSNGNSKGQVPLRVAIVPWLGWGRAKIAEAKGFFAEESVNIEHVVFQTVGEVNTALLAGQADLAWIAASDLVIMAEKSPGLKFIMACDYSGAVDAVIGRGITSAADARGKIFAREDVPYEIVFMAKYLETLGLTEADVEIVSLPAADGSAALIAGNVDAASVYEPFIRNAQKASGDVEVLFTAEGTNVIINGLAGGEAVLSERREDVLAYLRALEKGMVFTTERPDEANQIIGDWVGLSRDENAALMKQIVLLDLAANKEIAFNEQNDLNVVNGLNDAGPILVAAGKAEAAPDGLQLIDGSFIEVLSR